MEDDNRSVCSSSTDEESAICNLSADLFVEDEAARLKREAAVKRQEQLQKRNWSTGNHADRWASGTNSETKFEFQDSVLDPIVYTENPGQQQCIWDCALVLARYLESKAKLVVDKTVIELGCGLGLPGLVAGALGAKRVLLTDRPMIVPVLHQEIQRNISVLNGRVDAASLEWGNVENVGTFEVILCSDLVYAGDEATTRLLLETVSALQPKSSSSSRLLISCHEERHVGTEAQVGLFDSEMVSMGYNRELVPVEDLTLHDPTIKVVLYVAE